MFPGLANRQKTTDVIADGRGGFNVVTNDVIGIVFFFSHECIFSFSQRQVLPATVLLCILSGVSKYSRSIAWVVSKQIVCPSLITFSSLDLTASSALNPWPINPSLLP